MSYRLLAQRRWLQCLLLVVVWPPALSTAQILASERGSVSQTVDGTRIEIEFGRPRVRGRDGLFGTLEPWGRAWTPGADSATTLRVSRAVTILGQSFPAGQYSVWLVPREREAWVLTRMSPSLGCYARPGLWTVRCERSSVG